MKPKPKPIKPLVTREQMAAILAARPVTSTEDAYKQLSEHLGRPLRPGRKLIYVDGKPVLICCE